MLSFYEYSCAIELDYSSHVIILTYELVYSLYVMILTCATLCLTIHMTYMSRSRAKLRRRFIVPSGLPMSYACRSVGSEP
jgi:Ni/Fe-hydrogenase subunit HybB-like protein